MKCFYHHTVDAIAKCKNCNKGLCNDCLIELENGIACKESTRLYLYTIITSYSLAMFHKVRNASCACLVRSS
jgi:hypothetical protein